MSVCGRPDTAAILLPSPMALPPLRNGGRRIPEASANDGCTRGRPRRHGSVRPSPETCAGNQVQRPGVEWCPPDRRTTSLRGSEGDTHLAIFSTSHRCWTVRIESTRPVDRLRRLMGHSRAPKPGVKESLAVIASLVHGTAHRLIGPSRCPCSSMHRWSSEPLRRRSRVRSIGAHDAVEYALDLSGEASAGRESQHKIKLSLSVADKGGQPIKVRSEAGIALGVPDG